MVKVVKFGGSSLASAEQFKKVGNIIRAEESRRYVVPSAPGKRFSEDTKVTDMLYKCYAEAEEGKNFDKSLKAIKERYNEIIKGLGLKLSLEEQFETIKKQFAAKAGKDYAASRGEYLNGIIMANYLGYEFIDAATVICFDKNGEFESEKTNQVMSERLANTENAVIPGFYGAMPNGQVKTFSRGGSDVTGSIVARALKADVYENWTDVSGFLVADPRIVENPKPIAIITYKELRELNPSPYLYYFNFGDFEVIGSSPEMLVKQQGNRVFTCPIAGTRPRGKTKEEDDRLHRELLADEKERAEHVMLVDLARNDMGRISEFGTVKVTDFMSVKNYSHVMHIVSMVEGRKKGSFHPFDLLASFLPAGTLSGAPKIRAMEIIEELESVRRGLYGGATGYVDFSGDMDFCITIRTMIKKGKNVYLQAGAGIVADSVPENEYKECCNKVMALAKTLVEEENL